MKIKDLKDEISLEGMQFRDPKTGTTGFWYSQWGYPEGKAGIWFKKDMQSTAIFPLFLDKLEEALEFDVVEVPHG